MAASSDQTTVNSKFAASRNEFYKRFERNGFNQNSFSAPQGKLRNMNRRLQQQKTKSFFKQAFYQDPNNKTVEGIDWMHRPYSKGTALYCQTFPADPLLSVQDANFGHISIIYRLATSISNGETDQTSLLLVPHNALGDNSALQESRQRLAIAHSFAPMLKSIIPITEAVYLKEANEMHWPVSPLQRRRRDKKTTISASQMLSISTIQKSCRF